MKLIDGMGREIRSYRSEITKALLGSTSIVTVEGTEIAIAFDGIHDEINVSNAHEHHRFDANDIIDAIDYFIQMSADQV